MTMNENKQAEPVAKLKQWYDENQNLCRQFEMLKPEWEGEAFAYDKAPAVAHEPVAGWIQFVDGKQTQNFCRDKDEMQAIDKISRLMNKTLNITYQPVYTHPAPAVAPAEVVRELVETLQWYQEQARLCRLIHSEGDTGRNALANDGGNRAKAALKSAKEHGL